MLHHALVALSLLSLLGEQPAPVTALEPMPWPEMATIAGWESPWVLKMNAPDPQAKEIVRSYLTNLAELGFAPEDRASGCKQARPRSPLINLIDRRLQPL